MSYWLGTGKNKASIILDKNSAKIGNMTPLAIAQNNPKTMKCHSL